MSEQREGSIHSKLQLRFREGSGEVRSLEVDFWLGSAPGSSQTIVFPTGQQYDFFLFGSDGSQIWQWARGRVFTMMVQEKSLSEEGWGYSAVIPLEDDSGQPLLPGPYRLRAVMTGTPSHQHEVEWELPAS